MLIENHEPQMHRSPWIKEEDSIIHKLIEINEPLENIHKILRLRTKSAIYTRANNLGYGYKRNNDNGLTYFIQDINHKNRRTKDEILADEGKVPIKSAISVEDCDKESTVIIADKIDEIDMTIQALNKALEHLMTIRKNHERA